MMKHDPNTKRLPCRHAKRSAAWILAAVSCFSLVTVPQTAALLNDYTITACAGSDQFKSDTQVLAAGASSGARTWTSQNGRFQLTLTSNGNLYIYDTNTKRVTWQTNSAQSIGTDSISLTMQTDGNLVIYRRSASSKTAVWNTNTVTGRTSNGYSLRLSDDGELYVYFSDRKQSLFSTRSEIDCTASANSFLRSSQCLTSPNRCYRAIMQCDGNFVVYNKKNGKDVAIWNTKTANNGGAFLALQQDGNMVLYSHDSKVLYAAGTGTRPFANYKLSLGNDGVLTITRKNDNKVRWDSKRGKVINMADDAQFRIKSQYQYSSIDEAAKDFIVAYNGMSVAQNREYGSVINKLDNNKYVFYHVCWGALRGDRYEGDCGSHWCTYGSTVAYVHTHGKAACAANLYFSKADMDMVNNGNDYQYAYLGNASGQVYKYTKNQQPCSDYRITGTVSGTLLETNRGKYLNTVYDRDITSIQNSGDGIYQFG